ncbi:MAG: LVIVD repeat-containing protein [Saprospiraceae bacterium]|jgi:hypothetical protein
MKISFSRFYMVAVLALAASASACLKDDCSADHVYVRYDPVYIHPKELRSTIVLKGAEPLESAGKIYVYGQYLFVNEPGEGIHIFDNEKPASPLALGFLPIPGNIDLAVRSDILYADSYVDLVAFSLKNPGKPEFINRVEHVFPHLGFDEARGFLVDYAPTKVEEVIPCSEASGNQVFIDGGLWVRREVALAAGSNLKVPTNPVGIGGSTARFTIAGEHLYTVSNSDLKVFDLTVPEKPRPAGTTNIGWGIETIFPYYDLLFIGSRAGMFIFDTKDPLKPRQLAEFEHANACDPVVAEDGFAYVTLRSGTECEGFINQLEIIDVADVLKPRLLKIYPMHHPIGLSIVKGTLFICEDDQGLKVFNASNWKELQLLDHEKNLTAFDVIALEDQKVAIVTGETGIFQYDFSNPRDLKLLSRIQILGD